MMHIHHPLTKQMVDYEALTVECMRWRDWRIALVLADWHEERGEHESAQIWRDTAAHQKGSHG